MKMRFDGIVREKESEIEGLHAVGSIQVQHFSVLITSGTFKLSTQFINFLNPIIQLSINESQRSLKFVSQLIFCFPR
jgi:hypothetical protein